MYVSWAVKRLAKMVAHVQLAKKLTSGRVTVPSTQEKTENEDWHALWRQWLTECKVIGTTKGRVTRI